MEKNSTGWLLAFDKTCNCPLVSSSHSTSKFIFRALSDSQLKRDIQVVLLSTHVWIAFKGQT